MWGLAGLGSLQRSCTELCLGPSAGTSDTKAPPGSGGVRGGQSHKRVEMGGRNTRACGDEGVGFALSISSGCRSSRQPGVDQEL